MLNACSCSSAWTAPWAALLWGHQNSIRGWPRQARGGAQLDQIAAVGAAGRLFSVGESVRIHLIVGCPFIPGSIYRRAICHRSTQQRREGSPLPVIGRITARLSKSITGMASRPSMAICTDTSFRWVKQYPNTLGSHFSGAPAAAWVRICTTKYSSQRTAGPGEILPAWSDHSGGPIARRTSRSARKIAR
jgi:hypothetical protein